MRSIRSGFLLGAVVFAGGLALAQASLPEWHSASMRSPDFYRRMFDSQLSSLGLVSAGQPEYDVISSTIDLPEVYRLLKTEGASWLIKEQRGTMIEVSREAKDPTQSRIGKLLIIFSLDGVPWYIAWETSSFNSLFDPRRPPVLDPFIRALLRSKEKLGPCDLSGGPTSCFIVGSLPRQYIYAQSTNTIVVSARRVGASLPGPFDLLMPALLQHLPELFLAIILGVSLVYLFRSMPFTWATGLVVMACSLIFFGVSFYDRSLWIDFVADLVEAAYLIFIFILWVGAENLYRLAYEEPLDIDEIRSGRLTEDTARGLLFGCSTGMLLAGIQLALGVMAIHIGGVWQRGPTLALQNANFTENPLLSASLVAALVVLADAIARLFLRPSMSVVVAALLLSFYSPWGPWSFSVISSLPAAATLIWALRRFGITSVLVVAIVASFLPLSVFSALHFSWLPLTLAFSAVLQLAALGIGLLGVLRPRPGDDEPVRLFISYSRQDKAALKGLYRHLAALQREMNISIWFDGELNAGDRFNSVIQAKLQAADITLLLISSDFMASTFCMKEQRIAEACGKEVIPVYLSPISKTDRKKSAFQILQARPEGGRPVSQWDDLRKAYADITNGIREKIEIVKARRLVSAGNPPRHSRHRR